MNKLVSTAKISKDVGSVIMEFIEDYDDDINKFFNDFDKNHDYQMFLSNLHQKYDSYTNKCNFSFCSRIF